MAYTQRTCTLCNSNDVEAEYHVTLVCENFRDVEKINIHQPIPLSETKYDKLVELIDQC